MKKIMNDKNVWDHDIEDAVEGPVYAEMRWYRCSMKRRQEIPLDLHIYHWISLLPAGK